MNAYIAFEGPIAAGKTTWAKLLASELSSDVLLERFSENEFLADYYCDGARWAFPMQLWFLTDRHKQLRTTKFDQLIVADYAFLKEDVFSQLLLSQRLFTERELALYTKVRTQLGATAPEPSLFVYMDAETDVLLRRIRDRARPYEEGIDAAYLDRLRTLYDAALEDRPHIRVDTSTIDLNSLDQVRRVLDAIAERLNT